MNGISMNGISFSPSFVDRRHRRRRISRLQSILSTVEESLGPLLPIFTTVGAVSYGFVSYNRPLWNLKKALEVGEGIEVRESSGRGLGAFYVKDDVIKPGDLVGQYKGDLLTLNELSKKYPPVNGTISKNAYLYEIRESSLYIDASDENSDSVNWTRFINHDGKDPNLVVEQNALHKIVWFEAKREIRKGEELCFDYGDKYWEGYEDLIV
ncbi:hypothetical protein TrST_g8338 [Triparma strigata]|uniref:SET domain-containing protein n=1 Tax=Triparma strigata TaxID=1606541 RepID=A0A9W7BX31_9STRA|nr:hypothetical protein TrST_g8338 [Triparma strigata]